MKNKNSFKRTNPADAANIFVRNLLCDLSEELGGFSEKEWKKTLKYFNNRCAYTGEKLTHKKTVIDHLIAHNRKECGLHLYGNLIPATKDANAAKSSNSFEDFLNNNTSVLGDIGSEIRTERIEKIKTFQKESGYFEQLEKIQAAFNLHDFINFEYDSIITKAKNNRNEFQTNILNPEIDKTSSKNLTNDNLSHKIELWSQKPYLNVHKIIALVASNPGINKDILLDKIEELNISKNAIGTLKSLMSDSRNNYGNIIEDK